MPRAETESSSRAGPSSTGRTGERWHSGRTRDGPHESAPHRSRAANRTRHPVTVVRRRKSTPQRRPRSRKTFSAKHASTSTSLTESRRRHGSAFCRGFRSSTRASRAGTLPGASCRSDNQELFRVLHARRIRVRTLSLEHQTVAGESPRGDRASISREQAGFDNHAAIRARIGVETSSTVRGSQTGERLLGWRWRGCSRAVGGKRGRDQGASMPHRSPVQKTWRKTCRCPARPQRAHDREDEPITPS